MKAWMCTELGSEDRLQLEDVPTPVCGPTQVRIRVVAAGLNFADTLSIRGKHYATQPLPFIPGMEVAGEIVERGSSIQNLEVGQKVMSVVGFGGLAEEVVADPDLQTVALIPEKMDFFHAAGWVTAYGTSYHALFQRAEIQAKDTVLVLGSGGSCGGAAVELAKSVGATVIAGASSCEKLELARGFGADYLIDYSKVSLSNEVARITEGEGVNIVFDPVGGDQFSDALRSTTWNGRYLAIGFASGSMPQPRVSLLLHRCIDLAGVNFGFFHIRNPEANRANFKEIGSLHERRCLNPKIARIFPLDQAAQALKLVGSRDTVGKMVIRME